VNQIQGVGGVDQSLGTVGDCGRVFSLRALLEEVATQGDLAPVGEVREVAGGTGGAVHEVAVLDHRFLGTALEVVPDLGFAEVTSKDGQFVDLTDVDVVALSVTIAIARELRTFDGEGRVAWIPQDAVLVVIETTVDHAQRATMLGPNPRTVAIGRLGIVEVDAIDGDIRSSDHPDAFASGDLAVGKQLGLAARSADGQVAGRPGGHVASVIAGLNLDDVS
jgi:hypothetical protein